MKSAVTDIIASLGKTALFKALDADGLARVAKLMHARTFRKGELIFSRGDPGDAIYLVVAGRVRLSVLSLDGRAFSFNHARAGAIFGEIAALDGGVRTADATALTAVRTLTLTQDALKRELQTNLSLAHAAIVFLCQRLRSTSEQIEEVVLSPIEVRLARFLLHDIQLRQQLGDANPTVVDLGMPQGEIALLIGASRQSVNTALTALEKSGAFKRVGSRYDCNIKRLTKAATYELVVE
jgi:CRP/FNR family transcriptional regulator, cyclic AMP receptor protein